MSILSALKKKFNAKGNNIEEAIKTMEVGGEDVSIPDVFVIHLNGVVSYGQVETFSNLTVDETPQEILEGLGRKYPVLCFKYHNSYAPTNYLYRYYTCTRWSSTGQGVGLDFINLSLNTVSDGSSGKNLAVYENNVRIEVNGSTFGKLQASQKSYDIAINNFQPAS